MFACPIRENIAPGKGDAEVWESLKKVGLQEKVAALPKGIDTVYTVTYEEEGVDFSGGEEQKLALARVLNKEASLTILDEPTAAMDPLAEAEFYQKFHELIQGNLVIYISHRMSSSMFCDKILVLEDGKVSAFDTHQNLIRNQEGLYYKLNFLSRRKNMRMSEKYQKASGCRPHRRNRFSAMRPTPEGSICGSSSVFLWKREILQQMHRPG